MPRPERPIDASSSPSHRFAAELRALRRAAGNPSYRQLSAETHFSKATLSAAASGHRLPTWEVTQAYVRACGGDLAEWRGRWEAARRDLGLEPEKPLVPALDDRPAIPGRRRPALVARLVGIAAAAAAALALVAFWWPEGGPVQKGGIVTPSIEVTARYVGSGEPIVDNADPKRTGCASDPAGVSTLDSVQINTAAHQFLGVAELRSSPTCNAAWGRFTPSDRMTYLRAPATVTITARRPATGTVGSPFSIEFDGQAIFGDILLRTQGCVEIEVRVESDSGGGSATTACR